MVKGKEEFCGGWRRECGRGNGVIWSGNVGSGMKGNGIDE